VREPVVVVTGNLHGDECTGVGACLRLADDLDGALLRGAVHLYPSLNPDGLERRTRRHPDEDIDLNRLFPGDAGGGPAERLVAAIWKDIAGRGPDLVIDIHADAPGAIPYVLTDRATSLRGAVRTTLEGACQRLATATGLTVLQDYPDEQYARYRMDRSLTGAVLNRLQIPSLTIEAGPRLVVDPDAVAVAVQAVCGALSALGLRDGVPAVHPSRVGGAFRRDSGPRATAAGLLVAVVCPGALVRRGDVLAEIRSLGGVVLERMRAAGDGFVVAFAERAYVASGAPVCTFGFTL
jgi:predicted deacylase